MGWGKYQTAEEMEIGRRYEYDPKFLPFLYRWLNLKPGMTVVDVGCGSGYFTRILARGLKREGKMVGIDPDETLISEAKKIAKEEGLSNIEFRRGSIYQIPIPESYADLVVCHIVLINIPRQFDAIMEMKRVAKIGRQVAAIEPARGGGTHYPDGKLNELFVKFRRAFGTTLNKGWRQKLDMSQYIEDIHLKLPKLFLEAGLTEIRLNGYLSTFLLCDPRRGIEEMQGHLKEKLRLWQRLKKRNEECAVTGGMSKGEFQELFQLYSNYLNSMVKNPDKIRHTAEVEIVSRVIIHGLKKVRCEGAAKNQPEKRYKFASRE